MSNLSAASSLNAMSSQNAISIGRMVELRVQQARIMLAHAVFVSTAILAVATVVLVSIP